MFSRTLEVLYHEEDAATQEIEAGASVHPALDQPKFVEMTLRLSAASGHDKSGFDRRFILLRAATPASDSPWHLQPCAQRR
jgi:hypothetical protein